MITLIVSSATALFISALCSLMESVLLSLNAFRLETLKQEGHRFAGLWLGMKRQVDRPISAILILNTVAHTGGATIAGGAFDRLFGTEWIWLFSLLFTIAILVGTEILPKVIGVSYNERIAVWLGPILLIITQGLRPVIFLTQLLSKPFKQEESVGLSDADIQTLARMARSQNIIGSIQENIIVNATHFRTTRVESIMVPRERIAFISLVKPADENLELARRSLHTRYPVSRTAGVDDICGYVNLKEIATLAEDPKRPDIKPFMRPIPTLSQGTSLNRAFRFLAAKRQHMALIKDPSDRVVGLVTLEDLIEEVMGEIEDEFDEMSSEVIRLSPTSWKVGGGVPLSQIMRELPLEAPESHEETAFGTWLEAQLGERPKPGMVLTRKPLRISIQQTRRGKVHYALVESERPSPEKE